MTQAKAGAARNRRMRGQGANLFGGCAEDIVERHYSAQGRAVTERRWRGTAGEIDLVARDGDGFIFIEVKAARDFARAAERLTRQQIGRIYQTAAEYLGTTPLGQMSDVRFDVALVDGSGRVEVLEAAFGV